MPLDPSIALSVRAPQMPDPLESYARLMQIQGQQQQQQINKQLAPLHVQEQQQRVVANQQEIDQKQRAVSDMQTLDSVMAQPGGRDVILNNLPPHVRPMAIKQFQELDKSHEEAAAAAEKADAARAESMGRAAVFVREHQNSPLAAQGFVSDLKQKYADDPRTLKQLQEFEQQLQADPTPEGVKRLVDPIIASSSQRKVDISAMDANARMTSAQKPTEASLAVAASTGDPQAAAALAAMKSSQQKGKWVADYDENGKPIERWVAEGPGVVVPRQVAPQRPVVVGPNSKAVDPSTGAVIAEGTKTGPVRPVVAGNIDLYNRPHVQNADGTVSTVRSMSFEQDGKEILVPTVSEDGRIMSDDEAIKQYQETGKHLGVFNTPEEANAYADQLHKDYAAGKYDSRARKSLTKVDTLNDQGQPVTKFVEPTAGQEFIKQTEEKLTRPREVRPGSEEAFVIAYAKKLGKRPDDLTIDDQMKVRQAWSRADDKPAAAADDASLTLSPAGLDAAAVNYAKTATLPPMGMGKQGAAVRAKIINRAAEMFPGLDLASNKAGFAADQGALTQLQKQRDAIGAFEQTAGKNIDVFLKSAGKVVDTGSPMANTVARMVSGKMLGSPDQAAYDAARQVAINEIAKITSNPNLTGSLSDSARHEVDAFNPQSATLKQTVAVMRLLKQDMQNRTDAMDQQIQTIRGRIKGGGGDTSAPAKQAAPAGPAGLFSYQDYLKQKGGK